MAAQGELENEAALVGVLSSDQNQRPGSLRIRSNAESAWRGLTACAMILGFQQTRTKMLKRAANLLARNSDSLPRRPATHQRGFAIHHPRPSGSSARPEIASCFCRPLSVGTDSFKSDRFSWGASLDAPSE